MPALPEPLTDGAVQVREIAEWDIPEVLIAFQNDPELHRALGLRRPPTGADLGSQVEHAEATRLAGEHLDLSVTLPGSRDCVGRVLIGPVDWHAHAAPVRVWLAPHVRGLGYEAAALALVERWLHDRAGLRAVPGVVY